MTNEDEKAFQEWLATRPECIRAVASKYRPDTCYRMLGNPGHYCVASYGENADGTVTLTMGHLGDSYMPGLGVFGIDPNDLIVCGCGKISAPTEEQIEATEAKVNAARSALRN